MDEYALADGRVIRLLAEGRPSAVMAMSFANQVLSAIYMVNNRGKLDNTVHNVPAEIDREIAVLKLSAKAIRIDQLTEEQQSYLSSWQQGT